MADDDDDDDYDYDNEKLFLRPLDAVARGQKSNYSHSLFLGSRLDYGHQMHKVSPKTIQVQT